MTERKPTFCSSISAKIFFLISLFDAKIFWTFLSSLLKNHEVLKISKKFSVVFWMCSFLRVHSRLFIFGKFNPPNFFCFKKLVKTQDMTSFHFRKGSFLCSKEIVYKIHMQFFVIFRALLLVETVLSSGMKKNKIIGMPNRAFLALIRFIASFNRQISG